MTTTKTGQALQARPFTSQVTLIPAFHDGAFTGRPYKAEQVLLRSPAGGARLHVWFEADPRPHNHPWEWIACKVLHGFYQAVEYVPDPTALSPQPRYSEHAVDIKVGDPEHWLSHDMFHQVVSVEPGTVSVMSFGPIIGDGKQWGNLVKEGASYRYEPNSLQPGFLDALRHLNPHMRPPEWVDPYAAMPIPDVQALMAEAGL